MEEIIKNDSTEKISIQLFTQIANLNIDIWNKIIGSFIYHNNFGMLKILNIKIETPFDLVIYAGEYQFTENNINERYFSYLTIPSGLLNEMINAPIKDIIDNYFVLDDIDGAKKEVESKNNKLITSYFESEKKKYLSTRLEKMISCISENNWNRAEYIIYKIRPFLSKEIMDSFIESFDYRLVPIIKEIVDPNFKGINEIQRFFTKYEFEWIKSLSKRELTTQQNIESCVERIKKCLSNYDFLKADYLFYKSKPLSRSTFESIKSKYIQEYFFEKYGLRLNDDQAIIMASSSQQILIQARAGSGKTRTITSFIPFLVNQYRKNPDQLLLLAFNKNAAEEIRSRIRVNFQIKNFYSALTFHSFAYHIVQYNGKILFDNKGEFSRKAFSEFVTQTIREIWTQEIQSNLYAFFKKELNSFERAGGLLDDEEYLKFIRELPGITLNGEQVKSMGEKFIADYLFEHNYSYYYENIIFWDKRIYRPDFTLSTKFGKIIIEFWGIDENDSKKSIPKSWSKTWDEYHNEMINKRNFLNKLDGYLLLEFSIADLVNGRNLFEKIIERKLAELGLINEKLPEIELEKKVFRFQKDRMTNLFSSFIQIAKKNMWSVEETIKRSQEYITDNEREKLFISLGCKVFARYQEKLKEENSIDFDDLVVLAAEKIRNSGGNCTISPSYNKEKQIKVKDFEWIFIDEYQDFSQLFQYLLKSIQLLNDKLRVICVGDDWQAINSFAGSDLKFFKNFKSYFKRADIRHILVNNRSEDKIIEFSNQLMAGKGLPASALPEKDQGMVKIQKINDIFVSSRNDEVNKSPDQKFIFYKSISGEKRIDDNGYLQAKHLKACYQIIKEPQNWDLITKEKNEKTLVAILSHNNKLYHVTLSDFLIKLKSCFSDNELRSIGDFKKKIKISTVHSYKGLEADIVIILNVCEGSFPLLHPDNSLFYFFGRTNQHYFDEEQRLFYVAVTRACKRLYLLTEEGEESCFIKDYDF